MQVERGYGVREVGENREVQRVRGELLVVLKKREGVGGGVECMSVR